MPSKNSIKQYVENGYYHIYNRGVEKRIIFQNEQDYGVFLGYLKQYLLPKDETDLHNKLSNPTISYKERDKILKLIRLKNYNQEFTLLAYCLMPNHFHFLIKQKNADSIDRFMQSLCTRYTMYFNRKYKRVGPLFQSVYKAVLVESDEQFLHLTRYIHKQALALQGDTLRGAQPSSYPNYLNIMKSEWIHPEEVLTHFSTSNNNLSYKSFVEQNENFESIQTLLLEE